MTKQCKVKRASLVMIAFASTLGCSLSKSRLPPISKICGGKTSYFSYNGPSITPRLKIIGAFENETFNGDVVPFRIDSNARQFTVAKGTLANASIYLVPFSRGYSEGVQSFAVDVAGILPSTWPHEGGFPIQHYQARQLLLYTGGSNSFGSNPDWEAALAVWRAEVTSRSLRIQTFFDPTSTPSPSTLSSVVLFNKKERKVICFVPIKAKPSEIEQQLGACVGVLYGYLGTELDYSDELHPADLGDILTLEDCDKAIRDQIRD